LNFHLQAQRTLNKQEDAKNRGELEEELAAGRVQLSALESSHAEAQVAVERDLEAANAEKGRLVEALSTKQAENGGDRADAALGTKCAVLEVDVARLLGELEAAYTEKGRMVEALSAKQAENGEDGADAALGTKCAALEVDVARLLGELAATGPRAQEMQSELDSTHAELDSLLTTVEEGRTRTRDLEQALADAQERGRAEAPDATQAVESEQDGRDARLAAAEGENAELRKELERAREERLKELEEEAEKANFEDLKFTNNHKSDESETKMQALTDTIEVLNAAVRKYKVVTAKLHAKIKSTTEEHRMADKKRQSLVAELSSLRQKNQEVIHRFEAQRPHFNTITGCLLPLYKAALNCAKDKGNEGKGASDDANVLKITGMLETQGSDTDLPDLAQVADAFMAISDDLMLSLIRLRDLEREDTSKGGELNRLTLEHKESRTSLTGLQAEVLDLKKQNAILDDKHAKMKPLLVRANKHMEDTKRKVHAFKAHIAALTANLKSLTAVNNQHWICRPNMAPVADIDSKEDGMLVETQVEPDDVFVGVPVETCSVLRRIKAEGEVWLLLSVPADASVEATDESVTPKGPLIFWTLQTVFLERRAQRLASWQQQQEEEPEMEGDGKDVAGVNGANGAGANGANDSEPSAAVHAPFEGWVRMDPRADRQAAQSLAEVALSDGTLLPEAMMEALRKTFAVEWKAHAAQFQHNLQEMTDQLEEKNSECKAAFEELARYKARAHSVLEAQAADIAAANRELAEGAQLRADNARLSAKNSELIAQVSNHNPDDLIELRGQVEMNRSHVERLDEELKEAEDELQAQQTEARAAQQELRRQCTAELELVRADLGETEAALRNEKELRRLTEEQVKMKVDQVDKLDRRLAQLDMEYSQLQTDVARPDEPRVPDELVTPSVPSPALALRFPAPPPPPPALTTAAEEGAASPTPPTASAVDFLQSSLNPSSQQTPTSNGLEGGNHVDPVENEAEVDADSTNVQGGRGPELSRLRKHVKSLQVMLQHKEIEAANQREGETGLKKSISSLERENARNQQLQANMTYLKNIFIQYMTTAEHEKLFPVISQMLQLSPQEIMRVEKTRNASKRIFGGWI
jgi:DNA repair exonuclease SbcCD ATPase subunit